MLIFKKSTKNEKDEIKPNRIKEGKEEQSH